MLRYYLCIYLLAALGFSPVPGLSRVAVSRGSSLVAVHKALGLSGFIVTACGPEGSRSVVVVYELSCSVARGILPVQGWNLGPLHWFTSVQFSHSVMSDSLRPHESQHARPPCPSPTPGVYSNSCLSNWWCHPAISSSVVPFSSCPQPLPASGSFPMSQLFAWRGQSIGVSAQLQFFQWTPRTDLL